MRPKDQITKDLERTIQHHYEEERSLEMFRTLRRVLRLFELYRPDIGYIQGMDYLALTRYYYYDEFQLFVLFSNLIVTRPFLHSRYTFDLPRVFYIPPNLRFLPLTAF